MEVLTEKQKTLEKLDDLDKLTKVNLSVIITITNFESSIQKFYQYLKQALDALDEESEILIIDDGSTDNTWNILKELVNQDQNIKVLRLRSASGEAAAFEAGLKYCRGEKIIYITGRKRINPSGIKKLLKKLDEGYDLVMGWRYTRKDSKLNQVISRVFNWLIKKLYRLPLHDINSGIFAARRHIFEDLFIYGNMNIFLPVIADRKGYKVTECKIDQLPGSFRKSMSIPEYIQRLLDVITVMFLMNYSKKPLHFLGFIGLIFTLAGALMNLYLFFYRILSPYGIAGRPLLLLGALLLVIGIQMISIGLIGEIIIFTHARDLRDYSIEEIIE
ncbi:MAG: glycosyltransferase [Calditrichaeota bacterium]|nr:MAG: glycosyltransferase [Calditrichota bacterium]